MRVPTIIPTRQLVLTKSDEEKGAKEELSLHMRERHHTGWLLTVAPLVPFCPLFSAHPRKRKGFSAVGALELNFIIYWTGPSITHQVTVSLPSTSNQTSSLAGDGRSRYSQASHTTPPPNSPLRAERPPFPLSEQYGTLPFAKFSRKDRYCGAVLAEMEVLVQEFAYTLN